jgi:hypothetical protein
LRGAKASGSNHQIGASERFSEGIAELLMLVGDNRFSLDGYAETVEPPGYVQGVCV